MYKTKRERYESVRTQLIEERASHLTHWRDLADYIYPRRPRWFTSDANKGDRRNNKIVDNTATLAARTLRSGMMSGITSPARPWFRLTTPDPKLAEFGAVKAWLHQVTELMSTTYLKSNIYNVLPVLYGDLGVFSTAPILIEEDFTGEVIHAYSLPIGSYCLAKDHRGTVNTLTREFRMTVRQLIEQFGQYDQKTGKPDWRAFSNYVRTQWDQSNYETWIDVCHIIQPNPEFNSKRLHSKFKRFESCYYETGGGSPASGKVSYMSESDQDRYLSEKGYDYFPVLAPRWETTGEDVYGTACPGMDALGDIRQLQLGEKRIAQAIEKMINPPMTGPSSLRNQKTSILPGDITFLDSREGQQGFRPAHEVNPRIQEMEMKQGQVRERVRRAFFEDLFLMLSQTDRTQITAREIEERHEEKLLALGPVLEQLNSDLLDPLIDITFLMHERQGLIPPPPDELKGVGLKVEYVSVMAQAQKLVGLAGIERFTGYIGQIAQLDPGALDKVDVDQMIDVYGDVISLQPGIIRGDDDVEKLRAAKVKAAQAQQQAEVMAQATTAAKNLSQADMEGDNALTRLIGQSQAGSLV
jgi:hypothetical protein